MPELDLNDVLSPTAALRTKLRHQFVGRTDLLVETLAGIAGEGSALCVLGERGIGKTSATWRIVEYLTGDRQWLTERAQVPFAVPIFDVVWMEVYKSHQNLVGIILDLLNNRGRSNRWLKFTIGNELSEYFSEKSTPSIRHILNSQLAKRFELSLDAEENTGVDPARGDPSLQLDDGQSAEIISTFRNAVEAISEKQGKQLLFLLDEIDRLPDKAGLGDFIKSGNLGRYGVVGVADDIDELIISNATGDHPSSERKFVIASVERLTLGDIEAMIERANQLIEGISAKFEAGFAKLLMKYSDGFPFIAQRIARDALVRAMQDVTVKVPGRREILVSRNYFDASLDGFLNPNFDGGGRYVHLQNGIDNAGKEAVLFFMAQQGSGWVPVAGIEHEIPSKYGLTNNLIELETDRILVSGQDSSGTDSVRFIDPKMRAIVLRILDRNKKLYKKKRSSD